MKVFFDIETLPCYTKEFIDEVAKTITAPAQYKKADSIDAWLAENKQSEIEKAIAKTSFDGALGSICCIGWAIDDGEIKSSIGDEKHIITTFFNDLLENNQRDLDATFIGHNVVDFDLRFLFQRAVILGIKPPNFVPFHVKSWDGRVFDTMSYFAGYKDRISLDKLSKSLGLKGKTGVTGADVYPMFLDGKIEEIAEYCQHDVELTRNVYKRLTFN